MSNNLKRFIDAQEQKYEDALLEIKQGCKRSHWMWYIFPQIHGLGYSETSKYYAIKDIDELREYLKNEYLYNNLIEICEELLKLEIDDPVVIFGEIDAMKLKSSMTMFSYICEMDKNEIDIFSKVLTKFFNGEKDFETINIILQDINKD